MEVSPRFVALIVLLLFIFLAPDQTAIQRLGRVENNRIESLRQADFDVLTNSTYGELEREGVNLTGLRLNDGYQWQLLPQVKDIARSHLRRNLNGFKPAIYHRLNADVRGSFIRKNIALVPDQQVNLTALDPLGGYVSEVFQRNVTEDEGEISISLEDSRLLMNAREIKGTISLHTESAPGTGWEATLRGVHFLNGTVVMSTGSRKYNGLPALPHFALNPTEYNQSRLIMNMTVARLWEQTFMEDLPFLSIPSCELVVWLTQKPVRGSTKYISQVEKELALPDGAPIGTPEPLAFSAVIFSPDCGYVLEADTIYGPKEEAFWGLVQRLLTAFVIIVALEIALLKRQMEKCMTPSTRARISYYSIGIAAFGDGLILFAMIGLLMVEGGAFLVTAAATFLCCMHVAFFEVKFIFDIWTVQVGEPAQAQRERDRRAVTVNNTEGLPLPATAPAETTATPTPAEQIMESPRASFASLYSRFYFALINLMFFSLWALSWPQNLRSAYVNILAFCYFSLWIPQIHRNIMRNCRKALNWEYVLGTSILRAIPVLYWYFDDRNLLAAKPNPSTALILIAWLWMQITILLSQQYLGPRVLVKDKWCPPAYDYHPILSDDPESCGMPVGEVASASEGKDKDNKTRKLFDCAICMNEIDVPVITKDEKTGRSWLEQRNYMVTPCRHIFHTDCLEGWMNLRLVCPVCREGLPPL